MPFKQDASGTNSFNGSRLIIKTAPIITSIPEPSATLGFLAFSALDVGSFLKHQKTYKGAEERYINSYFNIIVYLEMRYASQQDTVNVLTKYLSRNNRAKLIFCGILWGKSSKTCHFLRHATAVTYAKTGFQ